MDKIIIILALCLACAVFGRSDDYSEKVKLMQSNKAANVFQHTLKCISESGVDPAILSEFRNKKYTGDGKVKKFLLCTFKKAGISNNKGSIYTDKLLEFYPKENKEEMRKVAEGCKDNRSREAADKVYNFFKCYQEKTPGLIDFSE